MCGQAILNGGFEAGDLSNWSQVAFLFSGGGPTSGGPVFETYVTALASARLNAGTNMVADSNGVLTMQTDAFDGYGITSAAIAPVSGSFLAFVTNETSSGNNTLTGSSISQTITVPGNATVLSFSLALLNNDASNAFVTYNDFGGAALSQGTTVLAQYNLDLNPASSANGHVTSGAHLGGFQNSISFFTVTFDVSPLQGQSIDLTFYAMNYGGDNSVETRLLIDEIQFLSIPEPATTVLLAMGVAGLLAWGGWCRRRARGGV